MTRQINIESGIVDLPALLLDMGDEEELVLVKGGREIARLLPTALRETAELAPIILPVAEYPDDYELAPQGPTCV